MIVKEKIEKRIEVDNIVVACDCCKRNIYNESIDFPSTSWFHVSAERLCPRSDEETKRTGVGLITLPRHSAEDLEMDLCSENCLQQVLHRYLHSCREHNTGQGLEILHMTGNLLKQQQRRNDDKKE